MSDFKRRFSIAVWPLALASLCGVMLAGCAEVRQFTYPRDFVYLDKGDVSSLMHSLANSMQVLEQLVENKEQGPEKSDAIMVELEKIEQEADLFAAIPDNNTDDKLRKMRTNHLLLDEHIDDFLANVALAKLQVQADPPNYYVIGQLTGGCNACHRKR